MSREPLCLEDPLLEYCFIQRQILDSTSHGCGRVLPLSFRLKDPVKQQGVLAHLHVHSITEVYNRCRSFKLLSHVDSRVVVGH